MSDTRSSFVRVVRGRPPIAILVGATAAVIGLVWWMASMVGSRSSDQTAAVPSVVTAMSPLTQENERHLELPQWVVDATELVEVQAPTEQPAGEVLPELAAPPAPALPHYARIDNPYRLYVPGELFAERYANRPLDQLGATLALLRDEVHSLKIEITNDYLDSGGAETKVIDRPKKYDETGEFIKPLGKQSHGLVSVIRSEVLSNGQLLVQTALLPWERYVSFYDIQDEMFWVQHEVNRLRRLSAETGSEL